MTKIIVIMLGTILLCFVLLGITSPEVEVVNKWDVPEELKEVSGIAYLSDGRFACVQDEKGVIFIFNTRNLKIEKKIPFGDNGDYEGIALKGKTAYVVSSEGRLYEIDNIDKATPKVKEYNTPLTEKHNVEGLCLDQKHNRLLLAIKDAESGNKDYKGIYAFDLAEKKMTEAPVFKINLKDPVFKNVNAKKSDGVMKPSEISINPVSDNIYLTEGTRPKLLIMDQKGNLITFYQLDEATFAQPEGMAFSPEGDLYISNEGNKGSGNILEVRIDDLK